MKLINRNDVLHLLLSCSWSFSSSFLRHLVEDFTKRRKRWSPWLLAQPVMPRNTNNTRGKTQWCRPSGNQDKEKTLKRVMRCLSTSNNSSKFRADPCSLVDCGCNNYGRRCDARVPGSAWKTMVALLSRSKVRQQFCTRVNTLSLKNDDDDNNNYYNNYNKLTAIDNLPDNAFLVSLDVTSMYTYIPHNEGIDAFRFFSFKNALINISLRKLFATSFE